MAAGPSQSKLPPVAEPGRDSFRETQVDSEASEPADLALAKGDLIGRYVLLSRLGAGGMGVVYVAYDPDLDRKLAIKILRTGSKLARKGTEGQTRLLREAQALAKLAHPNVVAIHDVGTFEGRVFVVMDYIDGSTLREWVRDKSKTWKDVVGAYVQAGRGLAAAHAAGLVHRDFKPDNALIDASGRVYVVDFGLARSRDAGPADDDRLKGATTARRQALEDADAPLSTPITKHGAVLGTPAYMSPEQLLGEAAEAAADQFAFCVALFEALYHKNPFKGRTRADRLVTIMQGKIRDVPTKTFIPGWLRQVVVRGLKPEPAERHADMEELLDALSYDRARFIRRAVVGLAFAATLGVAVWGYGASQRESAALCKSGDQRLVDIWDVSTKQAIHTAFGATQRPYAEHSWETIEVAMDGWTRRWLATYVDACEATHVRHEQSDELLDLRMACLDGRRHQLAAITSVLTDADDDVVENAVAAVELLPSIARCSDSAALRSGPGQIDEDARRLIADLEADVAQAAAFERAGKFVRALELAREAVTRADSIGHPLARAIALHQLGVSFETAARPREAEQALVAAAWAAEEADAIERLAQIRTLLVMVVGDRLGRTDAGHVWAQLAESAVARLGSPPELSATLHNSLALIFDREAKPEQVLAHQQRALELLESVSEPNPVVLGSVHNNLAGTLAELGQSEEGLRHAEKALELWTSTHGPDHPRIAVAYAITGFVHDQRGEWSKSLALYQRALELLERAVGPNSNRVSSVLNNAAIASVNLGDPAAGERYFRRALAIRERALGSDHLDVAMACANLGAVLAQLERLEEADGYHRRALSIREDLLPPGHPSIASSLNGLANVLELDGRHAAAAPVRERALAINREAYPPGDPNLLVELGNLAHTYTLLDRTGEAVRLAREAVSIVESRNVQDDLAGFAYVVLARAIGRAGKRKQARALLIEALATLGEIPARHERELIEETARENRWRVADLTMQASSRPRR